MLWAAIFLPQLALDGVLRRHPAPERPLALIAGPRQQRTLCAVNAAAAAAGLRPGLGLPAAHALLPRFECHAHDSREEVRLQQLLAAWAYRYSSLVCLEARDVVLLEVKASLGLFGPWPRFERRLREDLVELGFRHQVALAPTPLGASVLASARDGALALDRPQLERALAPVPLAAARLSPADVQALGRMGVRRLRELFALPRAGLARRFGPALPQHLEHLLGERLEPRECYRPPDRFTAHLEFNYEVEHHPPLWFPLKRMLGDLGTYLARRDGGVQRFTLDLLHAGRPPTRLPIGLLAPSREAAQLFELCRLRLEQVVLPAPVRGLRLTAHELPAFVPGTRDLFAGRTHELQDWSTLRERLRARLGDAALCQLQSYPDPRPEQACRAVPQLIREPPSLALPPRPAWLLPTPTPWRDEARQILAGPERIESGWWDGEDVRRDYYVVETRHGQRAWVFRPAGTTEGPWMLHGWFA
ncbi:MAG: DNA polymerase Y family protein [Gammaproteobacteria bacterium]